ncbi:hypothetical protein GQ43DRAFT_297125 [Delitschia confertaspora ATCC 74209]|uniref:Uncharacterized protein n=1 Tax=Delitschia confertaspora ATCC 74209 TaxID=1513339 RepID=A0A9P4JT95_9PLEO|nr:hypothetical protein GQ43DRAFT_297125 [Delitschia confertaspora ATCC 74209]
MPLSPTYSLLWFFFLSVSLCFAFFSPPAPYLTLRVLGMDRPQAVHINQLLLCYTQLSNFNKNTAMSPFNYFDTKLLPMCEYLNPPFLPPSIQRRTTTQVL